MAAGDTVTALTSVNAAASLSVQPGASIEWLITNIYASGAYELYRTEGSNPIKIYTGSGAEIKAVNFRCTNAQYFTIKNTTGGALYFGYDGIVWK